MDFNMDWLEKVKKGVAKTAKGAVKVSGDALEFTKAKIKLADINSSIDELYTQIGKSMYKSLKTGAEPQIDIEEIIEKIDALKEEAKVIEKNLAQVTNKINCPVCGARCDTQSPYCPKCGEKIQ